MTLKFNLWPFRKKITAVPNESEKAVIPFLAQDLMPKGNNEVLLVTFLVDDSESIEGERNTQAVIDGYNGFLASMQNAPGAIQVMTMFLNSEREGEYQSPTLASPLSRKNYYPTGRTPLYRRSVDALTVMVREFDRLTATGVIVRTITFIFTDGGDNFSGTVTAAAVREVVGSLPTDRHIVAGCAVSDGSTDFRQVFLSMGIPSHWIKVLSSGREVRASMTEMGHTTSRASASRDDFTTTSQTGFNRS